MPDRSNPKDMRLYCAYFPLSSLGVGNARKDRLHGGLNDCLDLIPDRSLVAHCVIGVLSASSQTIFPTPRLRANSGTAGRASTPPGRGTRGQCTLACGNPSSPLRKGGSGRASQRALNDPSFFSTAALLRPARAFCGFAGREAEGISPTTSCRLRTRDKGPREATRSAGRLVQISRGDYAGGGDLEWAAGIWSARILSHESINGETRS
jgi:hypothetical protein